MPHLRPCRRRLRPSTPNPRCRYGPPCLQGGRHGSEWVDGMVRNTHGQRLAVRKDDEPARLAVHGHMAPAWPERRGLHLIAGAVALSAPDAPTWTVVHDPVGPCGVDTVHHRGLGAPLPLAPRLPGRGLGPVARFDGDPAWPRELSAPPAPPDVFAGTTWGLARSLKRPAQLPDLLCGMVRRPRGGTSRRFRDGNVGVIRWRSDA